jgi:transcriptional regulator with XRE-family HTH domain
MTIKSNGDKIKELRKKSGLTQLQFSKKLKVNQAQLSLLEAGKRNITMKTFVKLAEVTSTSLDDLGKLLGYKSAKVVK